MKEKLKKIKVIVCDVDGVLTDGKIVYDSQGKEIKQFDAYDGFALTLAREMGLKVAFLSGRKSKVVDIRAKKLKIDKVYQNASPKIKIYKRLLKRFKAKDENICFIGDDLIDVEILSRVGFAVAVSNATRETKKVAHYVTNHKGGDGAVREVVEMVLKTQGKWRRVLKKYCK